MKRWLRLSNSLWGISLGNSASLLLIQKKIRLEKIIFIATNNWIALNCSMVCKMFLASNSPKLRKSGYSKALSFTKKRNKNLKNVKLHIQFLRSFLFYKISENIKKTTNSKPWTSNNLIIRLIAALLLICYYETLLSQCTWICPNMLQTIIA